MSTPYCFARELFRLVQNLSFTYTLYRVKGYDV